MPPPETARRRVRFPGPRRRPADDLADRDEEVSDADCQTGGEACTDRCFEAWDRDGIIWQGEDEARGEGRRARPGLGRCSRSGGARRKPIAIVARRRWPANRECFPMNIKRREPEPRLAGPRPAAAKTPNSRGFGRWWLAGCLLLAALFAGGMFGPSRAEKGAPVAAQAPANKPIEYISVGDRVVTRDGADSRMPAPTAVNPKTWKKLTLLAVTHWDNGTRDEINVETLQPPEWVKQHGVSIGAKVPLPLDLVEMGLPAIFAPR